jgi:hypothetical protein
MFQDQPSIPLGPIGVRLPSLTRRNCCGLLMLGPIGMAMPSLGETTAPMQENADRAEDDQKALKDFLEAYTRSSKEVVPGGGGAGGGGGDFAMFLNWVGEWIGRPVVSEVEAPPKGQIVWYYNQRSPFTEQTRREDHEEASVLRHLQEQTGLVFARERRPIRILFIERAK